MQVRLSASVRWKKFRDEQFRWFRAAENVYDNYAFYSGLGDVK